MRRDRTFPAPKRPWRWLRPDFIADSVSAIDFEYLQRVGTRGVYIDLDGTVVQRGTFEVAASIKQTLQQQPLEVYIATNRPQSRSLNNLQRDLGASGVVHPRGLWGKPFPRYFRTSLKERGLQPHEVVMIGDRHLQDILGANSAGLRTIAVKKLDQPTNWFDALVSKLEARRLNSLAKHYLPLK